MRNWKFVNLSTVTNNLDNKRIPLNSKQRSEKETNPIYPYIGANKIMTYVDEYIFDEKILCVAEDGGSWGHNETCAVIYNEKVWVNNHAHVLTAKENLVLEYLKYFLNYSDLNLHINGATRGKLTKSALNSIQIPLPPLETQKKIAAILDAADAYRQKTKALIAKYDELTQSLFLDMFGDPVRNEKGWEKVKLGLLTNMKAGKFVKASEILSEFNKNLFPCYGGNGLRGFVKTYTHDGNFVLIGRQGALCGNVKVTKDKFHATEHAIVCSPKMNFKTLWLYYLLDIINLNKYATGAAQPGLNVGTLVELEVINVPINLQNQFAERVQKIEIQKAQAQASLEKSEELFNSLLQRAFSGEMV